ncbi:MAG: hypothetical protein ACMG6E_07065 [Candidatus Roizmanbacteria bacterium]
MSEVRPFTLLDASKLSAELLDDMGFIDYTDDQYVKEQNWIIGKLTLANTIYTIIHGFPGDNASGAIFNEQEFYIIGEGLRAADNHPVQLWYLEVTDDATDWKSKLWYNFLEPDPNDE